MCDDIAVTQTSSPPPDPTLPVAERQLAMLGEVAQIAMVLSRAYGAAAIAAANAVEVILADEYWQPETGRSRALAGSKDVAEGFRKVSRSLRLTLAMEMKTAEMLRDLQREIITNSNADRKDAGETPADRGLLVRQRPAGSCSDDAETNFDKPETVVEPLVEFDRPDRLPAAAFREVVDALCVDIGVAPDWKTWRIGRPKPEYEPLKARPPGWCEGRPPPDYSSASPACVSGRNARPPPG